MPFNVGDRVVCVRAFNNHGDHGVVGQVYEVIRVDETWYTLRGLNRQVSETRFELVERAPPPAPEVVEPTVAQTSTRITDVRYLVVWCWHDEDHLNTDNWNYETWVNEEHARHDAEGKADDPNYILIGTKKITLTFNVEI